MGLVHLLTNDRLTTSFSAQGFPLTVSRTLETAPRHLISHPQRRVDAVSINQEEFVHRIEQVRMMKDIDSLADLVVLWLGERDTTTPTGRWKLSYASNDLNIT